MSFEVSARLPGDLMDLVPAILQRLGLPPAPMVTAGVRETAEFFRDHLKVDPLAWVDYLKGIDFHSPVTRRMLPAGARLIRHQSTDASRAKPFDYFAAAGASPTRLGTTFPQVIHEEYRTPHPLLALESVASTISFGRHSRSGKFDQVSRRGGDKQYIISHSDAVALQKVR